MQALVHRRLGDTEHGADLGEPLLLEVEQQHGFAQQQRQPADLLAQPVEPFLAKVPVTCRRQLDGHRQFDILDGHRLLPRPPQAVDAEVVGDPVQVGSEAGMVLQTGEAPIRPQERFLDQVVQVTAAADARDARRTYRPGVTDYQESKRLARAEEMVHQVLVPGVRSRCRQAWVPDMSPQP